ncbi:MAG: histidinol dehydrogenase [Gemmatimonadota bacterium]|nr:histidinol dehydrogenase [Gemmatimonadota bacterium]MDE3126373.1 histidinol dehydrogenase [Gemmatimonadota bacterium]MDE3214768.1 histidinol dehydrogenase [Gemmatimonadota bacterium]
MTTASVDLPALRYFGPRRGLDAPTERALLDRTTSTDPTVRDATAEILAAVRARGDVALREFARTFDGVALERLEVPRAQWTAALDALAPALRRAMERAARNIAAVHRAFLPSVIEVSPEPGITIGRRPDPLARVGVYAPGGRAAYPSSVLMGAVPARVAGVGEVVVASPPGPDGRPAPVVLAAAALAEADRVFAIGGAGAVGALAYGTASVPRVDRIVGPGNAYVAEAKLQVSGFVSIDSPAGPSELLVIADDRADAEVVAREMLGQAEHDPRAGVVAVAQGQALANRVRDALRRLLPSQERRAIIDAALAGQGAIVWVDDLDDAVAWSNAYAPEHLLLCVRDERLVLDGVRNAGTVFVGQTASVSFGDYMTGANHVLPTGGLARAYSGLSTLDYFRWTTYQRVDRAAAGRLAADVDAFAQAERLPGHAAAARAWTSEAVA